MGIGCSDPGSSLAVLDADANELSRIAAPPRLDGADDRHRRCGFVHVVSSPPADWEADVLGLGRIVWGSPKRYLTGVTPYVHAHGPRVPSLRRFWVKRPYLTNGSAPSVDDVLRRVFVGEAFAHDGAPPPGSRRLTQPQREGLAAFFDLL